LGGRIGTGTRREGRLPRSRAAVDSSRSIQVSSFSSSRSSAPPAPLLPVAPSAPLLLPPFCWRGKSRVGPLSFWPCGRPVQPPARTVPLATGSRPVGGGNGWAGSGGRQALSHDLLLNDAGPHGSGVGDSDPDRRPPRKGPGCGRGGKRPNHDPPRAAVEPKPSRPPLNPPRAAVTTPLVPLSRPPSCRCRTQAITWTSRSHHGRPPPSI
jgi:hypothetical protein